MTERPLSIFLSRLYLTSMLGIVIFFCIIRFVHLDADFPLGITYSGALYTDEGWYSNAAITHHLTGKWRIEGDFNPIVNMPVFHLIQAVVFSTFGMSLRTVRYAPVVFSILLLIISYEHARRYIPKWSALLCSVLLASNYIYFAHSRVALLEIPMICLIMLSILVAGSNWKLGDIGMVVFASFILSIAILLKSTALFAAPLLGYVSAQRPGSIKYRIILCMTAIIIPVVIFVLYSLVASSLYPDDFNHFLKINFSDRLSLTPGRIVSNFGHAIYIAKALDPVLYIVTMLSTISLLINSKDFRDNVLVRISIVWVVLYLMVLSTTYNHPARYFLPLLPPMVYLFCASMAIAYESSRRYIWLSIFCIAIGSYIFVNGINIYNSAFKPAYSFLTMAKSVEDAIKADPQHSRDDILIGNFTNSISLATGIPSVNTDGSRDTEWIVSEYKPKYYVSLGVEPQTLNALIKTYDIVLITTFDVYNNYIDKQRVGLFKLHPRPTGRLGS